MVLREVGVRCEKKRRVKYREREGMGVKDLRGEKKSSNEDVRFEHKIEGKW